MLYSKKVKYKEGLWRLAIKTNRNLYKKVGVAKIKRFPDLLFFVKYIV